MPCRVPRTTLADDEQPAPGVDTRFAAGICPVRVTLAQELERAGGEATRRDHRVARPGVSDAGDGGAHVGGPALAGGDQQQLVRGGPDGGADGPRSSCYPLRRDLVQRQLKRVLDDCE